MTIFKAATSQTTNNFGKQKLTKLSLTKNEIHLWAVQPQNLSCEESYKGSSQGSLKSSYANCFKNIEKLLTQYKKLLTVDETKKQQRYKFQEDRHDALITRAFIRDLLSQYADIQPGNWRFEKGEKDKPEICNPPLPLRFNISHTKNLIICAVMLNDDIGCDVENTTRNNDVLAIADRFFSPSESAELFSLPLEQQRSRFFDYWTLKESYIKAWGLGLAIPLKDFSFNLDNKTVSPLTSEYSTSEYSTSEYSTSEYSTSVSSASDSSTSVSSASDSSTLEPSKMKDTISLSFAKHRIDQSEIWRSWLFYPSDEHRIALSVKAKSDNQKTPYKLRFFKSVPLVNYHEVSNFSF